MPQSLVSIDLVEFRYFDAWNHANLQAPYWRLYWNTNSKAAVVHRGKRYPLKTDHLYLIPAHAKYTARSEGVIGHLYIHFEFPWACTDRSPMSFRIDTSVRQRLQRLIELLQGLKGRNPDIETFPPEAHLLAHSLVTHALSLAPFERFEVNPKNQEMEHAAQNMAEQLEAGVDTTELAQTAGMSLSTFRQRFSTYFGITPHRYLTMLRIDRSASLLDYTEQSIDAIAQETGFSDRYHLTKVFARIRGTTPAAYRKRHTTQTSPETLRNS